MYETASAAAAGGKRSPADILCSKDDFRPGRIGDQASDIAEILPYLQGSVSESKLHIKEMAQATIKMVTDSIESFVRRDLPLARSVVEYDNVVDGLFNKVKTELIRLISEDSNNGEFCIDLLMVAKYFERIGDHAVNVAEWVQYSLTGRKDSLLADADDIPWTEDMA